MLLVNELFSGIGSQTQALKNIGVPHKVVGIAEIDRFAIQSYEAIHGKTHNYGDISKIQKVDYADLWSYSFPCTDLSISGKQAGLHGGTRSGLLYEVERLLKISKTHNELPKFLLLENVKNLVGKQFKPDFDNWLETLDNLGYKNYYKVLNAKDYGIAQSRERIFCISIRKDINMEYSFPKPIDSTVTLINFLEETVDEKYYLSEKIQERFQFKPVGKNIIDTTKPEGSSRIGQADVVYKADCVMGALLCRDYKQPKQIMQVGMLNIPGNEQVRRVYSSDGISPTLNTCGGGNRQVKILKNSQIRKLTPREYWRLMGFKDKEFDKARESGISDSQLYRQSGNSIVVNVLEAIFNNLFKTQ